MFAVHISTSAVILLISFVISFCHGLMLKLAVQSASFCAIKLVMELSETAENQYSTKLVSSAQKLTR